MTRIYLDHSATCPALPRALDAFVTASQQLTGNPSSAHTEGRAARGLLEEARESIASRLGFPAAELLLTSGGSESCQTALLGVAEARSRVGAGRRILTSPLEHACVDAALQRLVQRGFERVDLPVSRSAVLDLAVLAEALQEGASLVSLLAYSNELGTLLPLREVAELCAAAEVPLHLDGVALLGRGAIPQLPGRVLWSFSAHKIGGLPGIGVLRLPADVPFAALLPGAQELGRRAGTESAALAAAFAAALQAGEAFPRAAMQLAETRFLTALAAAQAGVEPLACGGRLPGVLTLHCAGVRARSLVMRLDLEGLACSRGAACSSGAEEPSQVVLGLGYGREFAESCIRVSLGPRHPDGELERAAGLLAKTVRQLRR